LSQVPKLERFGAASLNAQSEFLKRMPDAEVRYGENGAISWLRGRTGIVLLSGLAQFKVGQGSKELLQNIGPALLASGTEELRVQYIRGREVQDSSLNIVLNQQTNEITLVVANFLQSPSWVR
jgi:hypothetical protein